MLNSESSFEFGAKNLPGPGRSNRRAQRSSCGGGVQRYTKFSHRRWFAILILGVMLTGTACRQSIIRQADRNVYGLIEDRQRSALGMTSDVNIGAESGKITQPDQMYSFTPRSIAAGVPDSFALREDENIEPGHGEAPGESQDSMPASTASVAAASDPVKGPSRDVADEVDTSHDLTPDIYPESIRDQVEVMNIRGVLVYAMRHGRILQSAKEDLYRAALDLSLERHLWTPQFVASVSADYDDFEREAEFDQTMTAIADFAVTQRLPYGGDITARVIDTLVRDLNNHATAGESGQLILEAGIPLLRGAGRVAYESRYVAERELIYAVRAYERFRREFLVLVASDYFNLQQLKTAIQNTYTSYLSRRDEWERADFIDRMGQSRTVFDAPRAKSILRQAEAALVSSKEQYASALDRFKVFIGMPVDALLDVLDQEEDVESRALERLLPEVDEAEAIRVALRYRLDLLTSADRVDDAARGVLIAENRILPDLELRGSVLSRTNPEHRSLTTHGSERTSWSAGIEVRLDDRKAERNAYRSSLINQRRSQRTHEESADLVRADVRRALRRIAQQVNLLRIQALNVEENTRRLEAAKAQFALGKITNIDVVDAENDLLAARNDFARAVASFRVAILEFRRDTGTLRITDEGLLDMDIPLVPPAQQPGPAG
jgi:hypothetical protein